MLKPVSCIVLGIILVGVAVTILKLLMALAGLCLLAVFAFMVLNQLIKPN